MRLLVDAGNSRVKWSTGPDAQMHALVHRADAAATVDALISEADPCAEAIVVDVTGAVAAALAARIPNTRVLRPVAAACGVTNGYAEPARLGADRWAALIGAHTLGLGACCVVDAGTALTLDVLAADGRHLGGWIAPGQALARAALVRGTHGVRPDARPLQRVELARDTTGAVDGGIALAMLGFIERGRRVAAKSLAADPMLIVTGGDAALVAAAFPDAVHDAALVLRGLAAWADV